MKFILFCFILILRLFGWGEDIRSIKAKFIQTTYQNNEKILYSGILFASNPNLAKWIYETPIKKEIYLNKQNVIIFEPLLEQATFSKISHQVDFFSIITSAKLGDDGNYYAKIGNIDYKLILKNNKPYQIIYKDDLQNLVEISLYEVQLNTPIDSKTYIFTPNANIDIIRQ